jgi:hypothetical protein
MTEHKNTRRDSSFPPFAAMFLAIAGDLRRLWGTLVAATPSKMENPK